LSHTNSIATAWSEYAQVPLPGWAAHSTTLFDCSSRALSEELPPADFACASIAFDGTASSRPGAKHGPAAIRKASLIYSSQTQSRGSIELRNMRTGRVHLPSNASIVDYGDLHVFQSNPEKQIASAIAESYRIAATNKVAIFLGGEHMISAATYHGVAAAAATRKRRVAYLQIDHHFDFGDTSVLHGRYYHGSNARRISELSLLPPAGIGFFGVGDLTSNRQFLSLTELGYPIVSTLDLMQEGVVKPLHGICRSLLDRADEIYVSIDIDVCDSSCAPGTGHVTAGGLNSREFLSICDVIKNYPIAALDIVEVSPQYDPSGATSNLAARFLYEFICLNSGIQ
jgi:agmatinase